MRWLWVLLWLPCSLVWAHAELLQQQLSPLPSVEQRPHELLLVFNESIEPLALELVGAEGAIALPAWQHQGERLVQPLPELSPGQYWLRWQVRSLDGHLVSQDLRWQWGQHSQAALGLESPSIGRSGLQWLSWLWPLLLLPWMLLLAGQRLLKLVLPAWPLWPLWPLLGLQALYWLSLEYRPQPWPWLLLAAAGLWSLFARPWPRASAAGVGLLLLVAVSVQGHANAFPLALQLVYGLHWGLAALWWAALTQLCLQAPQLRPGQLQTWLACFSAWALPLLLVALVAGGVLAWQQLGWPWRLPVNAYQGLLLAKLGILSLVLLLAAWHRWGLPVRLARVSQGVEGKGQVKVGRVTLWLEWGLLLLLLWVTAVMAAQAPRAGQASGQASAPVAQAGSRILFSQVEDWHLWLYLSPEAGVWQVRLGFEHQGQPQSPEEVELWLQVGDGLPLTLPLTWQGAVVSTSWPWGLQTQTTTLHGRWLLDDFRRAHQAWPVPSTPPLP